ncbi:MAG: hypothetical protein ACJ76J_12720 [Thermoanaerobaculia bacterium]
MARMKKIALQVGLVAVLALLGTAAAQAQYDWPKANSPYHCHWERYNTSGQLIGKGVSLVTFTNVTYPNSYTQSGTNFNVYADASTLSKSFQVQLHVAFGGLTYYQPNPTNPEITCQLLTSSGGNTVEWAGCSNGVRQWCSQP